MTTTCTSNYAKLLNTLEELNMPALRANISTYIDLITSGDKNVTDALYELFEKEIEEKEKRTALYAVKTAGFPFEKRLKITISASSHQSIKMKSLNMVHCGL